EAVAWPRLVAEARDGAVEAVPEPVGDETGVDRVEPAAIVGRERVRDAGRDLGEEADGGEAVRRDPPRHPLREPPQGAPLGGRGEALALAARAVLRRRSRQLPGPGAAAAALRGLQLAEIAPGGGVLRVDVQHHLELEDGALPEAELLVPGREPVA